jgi:hypothetical protein
MKTLLRVITAAIVAASLVIFPALTLAASHSVTPSVVVSTPLGTTFHLDWASLAAAKADTGTAIFNLNEYKTTWSESSGINSSGAPVVTLTIVSTFAASIDSARSELHWGPTTSGPWIPSHTFTGSVGGANSTLVTATVPFKSLTFTAPVGGYLRYRKQNAYATTAGLIDDYVTVVRRRQ